MPVSLEGSESFFLRERGRPFGTTDTGARGREVREEAGIELNELTLVGVYSDLNRDPRGHIVSVAYGIRLPCDTLPSAGSDATSAEWVDARQITLGLDHARMLADANAKILEDRDSLLLTLSGP